MREPVETGFLTIGTAVRRWWRRLTEPAIQAQDAEQNSQIRLVASITLALALFGGVRIVLGVLTAPVGRLGFTGAWVGVAITLLIYAISRSRWYGRWTQWVLLLLTFVYPLTILWVQNLELGVALAWMILPILFAALFFAARGILLIGVLAVAAVLTIPQWLGYSFDSLVAPAIFVAAVTLFLILLQTHRQYVERQRQAELAASQEQLHLALDSAEMGIWDWDILADHITWSPQVHTMLGLPALEPEMSFARYQQTIHEEDRGLIQIALDQVFADPQNLYWVEHRVRLANDDIRWLESTAMGLWVRG